MFVCYDLLERLTYEEKDLIMKHNQSCFQLA
jgi:hypothetical protein